MPKQLGERSILTMDTVHLAHLFRNNWREVLQGLPTPPWAMKGAQSVGYNVAWSGKWPLQKSQLLGWSQNQSNPHSLTWLSENDVKPPKQCLILLVFSALSNGNWNAVYAYKVKIMRKMQGLNWNRAEFFLLSLLLKNLNKEYLCTMPQFPHH